MAKHGIFESTKLYGCMNVSFVSATDEIDNGSIVANDGLATGYIDVYTAKKPTVSDAVYVVGQPVYGYDDRLAEDINEDNFTNPAGKPFRTYELKRDRKFKVSSDMITPIDASTDLAVGQYVVADGTYKLAASATIPSGATFVGIIEQVEETGFPYFGSSKGQLVTKQIVTPTGTETESYGYTFDTRLTKIKIRVLQNG